MSYRDLHEHIAEEFSDSREDYSLRRDSWTAVSLSTKAQAGLRPLEERRAGWRADGARRRARVRAIDQELRAKRPHDSQSPSEVVIVVGTWLCCRSPMKRGASQLRWCSCMRKKKRKPEKWEHAFVFSFEVGGRTFYISAPTWFQARSFVRRVFEEAVELEGPLERHPSEPVDVVLRWEGHGANNSLRLVIEGAFAPKE